MIPSQINIKRIKFHKAQEKKGGMVRRKRYPERKRIDYQRGSIEKDGNRQRNSATIQDEETTI